MSAAWRFALATVIFALLVGLGGGSFAHAQSSPMSAPTSKNTAIVVVEPDWNQHTFKVTFLDPKTNQPIQHIYFDLQVMKNGNQIFSAAKAINQPIIHIVGGTANGVSYNFPDQGSYNIRIFLEGTGLPEVPTGEDVSFSVNVTPEFPVSAVMGIMSAAMLGSIILATKAKKFAL